MSSSKPKILVIAPRWESISFGGQQRTSRIVEALGRVGDVSVWVLNNSPEEDQVIHPEAFGGRCIGVIRVRPVPPTGLVDRVRRQVSPRCLQIHGYMAVDSDVRELLGFAGSCDLVWIRYLTTANILGQWNYPRTVLDIDDVPSSCELTYLSQAQGILDRLRSSVRLWAARRREKLLGERFVAATVCNGSDVEKLSQTLPTFLIPNGFDMPAVEPSYTPAGEPLLGFIGLYSHIPNQQGVEWFIRNCWDRIKQAVPNARLRLIGKGTDGPLPVNSGGIDGLGYVADAASEFRRWSLMIVPIFIGGGSRVKVAEGFARKCPMVATELGAHGYACVNGKHILVADDPERFAQACIDILRNRDLGGALAEAGWELFVETCAWDGIQARIADVARRFVAPSSLDAAQVRTSQLC